MRFALDDQIAAQPEVVARIVSREMPCLAASRPPGTGDQGRMATLRALLAELGARVWTCGEADEQLPFARTDPWMRPFTSIIPLQRLTAELARLRHTDPDTL